MRGTHRHGGGDSFHQQPVLGDAGILEMLRHRAIKEDYRLSWWSKGHRTALPENLSQTPHLIREALAIPNSSTALVEMDLPYSVYQPQLAFLVDCSMQSGRGGLVFLAAGQTPDVKDAVKLPLSKGDHLQADRLRQETIAENTVVFSLELEVPVGRRLEDRGFLGEEHTGGNGQQQNEQQVQA